MIFLTPGVGVDIFRNIFILSCSDCRADGDPDFTGTEMNSSVKFCACSLTAYLGDLVEMQFSCFTSAVVHFAACGSEVCCCHWGHSYCWAFHPRYLHKSDPGGFP